MDVDEDGLWPSRLLILQKQLSKFRSQNQKLKKKLQFFRTRHWAFAQALADNGVPTPTIPDPNDSCEDIAITDDELEVDDPHRNFPFAMRQMHVIDAGGLDGPLRCVKGRGDAMWPHSVEAYGRAGRQQENLFNVVEKRHKQYIGFEMFDHNDHSKSPAQCTQELREMLVEGMSGNLKFVLELVYADNVDETVCLVDLNVRASETIDAVTEPQNALENPYCLVNGIVQFPPFKLNVLSSNTYPMHRQFRYVCRCVNRSDSAYVLTAKSAPFYCKAKSGFTEGASGPCARKTARVI